MPQFSRCSGAGVRRREQSGMGISTIFERDTSGASETWSSLLHFVPMTRVSLSSHDCVFGMEQGSSRHSDACALVKAAGFPCPGRGRVWLCSGS